MNRKILFVDDEPAALGLYRQMLQDEYDVSTAVGGEDGIVTLRNLGPFAIVISDMQMPGMDGAQFLSRVRQLSPRTIRLLLTGRVDLNGAINAVNEGGVFRLLIKPCEESVLTEAITTGLACYHQRKEERVRIEIPVQLWRPGFGGKLQSAHTVDISNLGVRLAGLEGPLELGEVLTIECGDRRAAFRVVWMGALGTAAEGQAGLECMAPDSDLWKIDLSQAQDGEALVRAGAVQRALMPQEKPPLKSLDYDGHCIQARTVGGDYYDFLDLGPEKLGFVLADVSGKGIPAALLMASLQGNLRSLDSTGSKDLPQLLAALNLHLFKHTANQRYVTLFFGRYTDANRTLHYVNCGHNPPVLLRNGGSFERLEATAMVLGLFSEWECSVSTVQLEVGDVLCMYSDGVTEATGRCTEQFGEARLLETLRKNRDLEAAHILRIVVDAVEQFRLGKQADDLTLVIGRAR